MNTLALALALATCEPKAVYFIHGCRPSERFHGDYACHIGMKTTETMGKTGFFEWSKRQWPRSYAEVEVERLNMSALVAGKCEE